MLPISNHKRSFILRRVRRGVSLLEVLISIFVLMVGLLGVAALIPVGRHHIAEGLKADRAAACGQAILHEARIRGWLDPTSWRYADGTPDGSAVVSGSQFPRLPRRTYVIDPLFITYASSQPSPDYPKIQRVPYDSATDLRRVTLARVPLSNGIFSLSESQRLCTWHDDLLFPTPDDTADRPRALVLAEGTPSSILWPIRPSDNVAATNALLNQNQGDFSWLLTVTPLVSDSMVELNNSVSYQLSVVVFQKRDLSSVLAGSPPGERLIASINFGGFGYGGGDVELRSPSAGNLEIKENDWIMVPFPDLPSRYEWYRVVATDDAPTWDDPNWKRNVTLAGRDWRFSGVATNAVVFSDVAGVFTATVPSEGKD